MNKPTGKLAMAYRTIANMEAKIAELVSASQASMELVSIVTAERDALAAQLAALNKLHSDLTNADMVLDDGEQSGYLITSEQLEDMEHYLSEPILCLAAHDAEVAAKAIEDAVQLCNYYSAFPVGNGSIASYVIKVDDLKQCAAQLRAKAGA